MEIEILIPIVLGMLSGWMVNYLADVLPRTRKFTQPVCHSCGAAIPPGDYLLFRSCHQCKRSPKPRSWIVSIGMIVLSVLLWYFHRPSIPYPLSLAIILFFAVVLIIDVEYRLILNPVSIVGAVLGFASGVYLRSGTNIFRGIWSTLAGGAAGFLVMLFFYYLGTLYVRAMARRNKVPADEVALGFGDVNLAGIIGFFVGWPAIFVSLFFAILGGGIISLLIVFVLLLLKRYKAFTAIPYAPFLILGACYLLFILP
jgi:leader peptidase (prepilin peptidase)/N-methyltransferase